MSFSTTAAACQKEINVKATVVATTTLVVVGFVVVGFMDEPVCICFLVAWLGTGENALGQLNPLDLDRNDVMSVLPQGRGKHPVRIPPPPRANSDHDE